MKEDDRFIPFFEAYKDDFFESMEDVRMYLKNNNLEYKNTQQKLHNILDNNINSRFYKKSNKKCSYFISKTQAFLINFISKFLTF